MEETIHLQVLGLVFALAVVMGAVVNKTHFCTMGAVSDWVNMGDTGRLRAWLLAMAVALAGVTALQASGRIDLGGATFPPYRSEAFAWLRYLAGGVLFGIGMTLASGCGNKTLVRVGGGNLKSLVVLVIAALAAWAMLWTPLFERAFLPWVQATTVRLSDYGIASQSLGAIAAAPAGSSVAALERWLGVTLAIALAGFVFGARDFRNNLDNVLGGLVVGLTVAAGWWITAGSLGAAWKDFAAMAIDVPSRVETQSYTFISPMGDTVRWLMRPTQLTLINFGVVALAGVIVGSAAYAIATRTFRIEWFASFGDFVRHAVGGVLMGVGGVLSMGCTIGQAITGVSTLAAGSILTFLAIVAGAAATMKFEYWRMLREA